MTNVQCWNRLNHCQTIHPTEILISMNLLQMPCMITQDQNKSASNLQKKVGGFLVVNIKNLGSGKTIKSNTMAQYKWFWYLFVLYLKSSTSQILGPSPQAFISNIIIRLHTNVHKNMKWNISCKKAYVHEFTYELWRWLNLRKFFTLAKNIKKGAKELSKQCLFMWVVIWHLFCVRFKPKWKTFWDKVTFQ